jgi:biotin carboxyl carrier protein
VGLVEVMKMFNGVTAGVRGRVVEILAANDSFVEHGEVLMTIRPEPAG